jgi:ribonucleoside-diphosphate reductase alpha chain
MSGHYDATKQEKKKMQGLGLVPEWMSTPGYQLFKSKYLHHKDNFYGQARLIAQTLAKRSPDYHYYAEEFFQLIWKGWLSCSTPVLANTGTDRGLPVSCSGQYVPDSIEGFYESRKEAAILTKHGFGTSGYLGDIRPRGAPISVGGKASGTLPEIKGFVQVSRDVSQGGVRRGSFASYLPMDHGDFWEVVHHLESNPDDLNLGWNISDSFLKRLRSGEPEAVSRYQEALKVKMITGKGYFFFPDKANRRLPEPYKKFHKKVHASNLCSEIILPSDEQHTFTCVLSSMNLSRWDEWKDTNAVQIATVFLDCVASEFIAKAKNITGLDRAVAFTEKARALGLGACGFHTYLQMKGVPFESLDAMYLNHDFFSHIKQESDKATRYLAEELGEPEWCKGFGVRNASLRAVAPTKSTALIMGGISEGINPDPAMIYNQATAAGEVDRINPVLYEMMKERGVYNKREINKVIDDFGSVKGVDWLSDSEKEVFKTAFEIGQGSVVRLASSRARYLDQWQSVNLFFAGNAPPEYISQVHQMAFEDENMLALYYVYSSSGVGASKDECVACM